MNIFEIDDLYATIELSGKELKFTREVLIDFELDLNKLLHELDEGQDRLGVIKPRIINTRAIVSKFDDVISELCKEEGKENKTTKEMVDHPIHYNMGKYEAIDVIEDWNLGFNLGNTIKYISRAGHKDKTKTIEDLKKSLWYLQREIANLEGK